jgi:hypothetical protein
MTRARWAGGTRRADRSDQGWRADLVQSASDGGESTPRISTGHLLDDSTKESAGLVATCSHGSLVGSPLGNANNNPSTADLTMMSGRDHVATSPALSFVLSSKRDLRLVRHVGERAGTTVLAFDAGGMASGNLHLSNAQQRTPIPSRDLHDALLPSRLVHGRVIHIHVSRGHPTRVKRQHGRACPWRGSGCAVGRWRGGGGWTKGGGRVV